MSERKRGIFDWYFKTNLLLRIFLGLVLGAVVGILLAQAGADTAAKVNSYIAPFGNAFIRLLQMIIVPTILFTLIVGTASIEPSRLGRVGVKTILYYGITSVFAVIVGLVFALVTNPGTGINLVTTEAVAREAQKSSVSSIILNVIPTNMFDAMNKGSVLQIIFFAILIGLSLAFLKEAKDERVKKAANTVFVFFEGMVEVIFKIVGWIMQYAPIGVFALLAGVFALNGSKVVGPLIGITIILYIALAVHLIFVYGGFLVANKLSLWGFIKRARAPMLTAFVTRSSGGTLPISLKTAENMGVSRGVYSFSLPLGATINMDGTTIYEALCVMFIANAIGSPLDFGQMLMVVLTAVLAAVGTAGVPGAGAIMLLLVLESVGLKVEAGSVVAAAYAMILGIDALLDMGRTAMNVTGDMVGALVVAKSEKEFDREKYNAYDGSNT
ncbi:MAG: dicarboxylate/amino acid:cation symporter [Elusimicrobiota bacterium]|jgi:Na+/H+-dicarboxylate symporter|nr:dicarboxylate/amino acid:cation symporter [Elusimicrobiota bacterium]